MKIRIIEHLKLDGIPSGSALEKINDRHFVFGDDSPYLHIFTDIWLPLETLELPEQDTQFYRIPKPIKHDIESAFSCTSGHNTSIFALGSGAVPNYRENIFIINYDALSGWIDIEKIHAGKFYQNLKNILPKNDALNIEGAALVNDTLYLAQRGHLKQENYIFSIPFYNQKIFETADSIPVKAQKVDLAEDLKGFGISGLAYDSNLDRLWCCGSFEAITDTYNDGEIGQSFIGYFEANKLGKENDVSLSNWSFITLPTNTVPVKIESLTIEKSESHRAEIHAISDDDIGGTDVFILEVNY